MRSKHDLSIYIIAKKITQVWRKGQGVKSLWKKYPTHYKEDDSK